MSSLSIGAFNEELDNQPQDYGKWDFCLGGGDNLDQLW